MGAEMSATSKRHLFLAAVTRGASVVVTGGVVALLWIAMSIPAPRLPRL